MKKKVDKGLEKTWKKKEDDKYSHLDEEAAEVERAADEREKRKAEKKKAKKDKSEKKKKKDKKDSDGDGKAYGSGKDKKSAALSIPFFNYGPSNRYNSDGDTPLSLVSTAVPSDEEFLTSWDEWGTLRMGGSSCQRPNGSRETVLTLRTLT